MGRRKEGSEKGRKEGLKHKKKDEREGGREEGGREEGRNRYKDTYIGIRMLLNNITELYQKFIQILKNNTRKDRY